MVIQSHQAELPSRPTKPLSRQAELRDLTEPSRGFWRSRAAVHVKPSREHACRAETKAAARVRVGPKRTGPVFVPWAGSKAETRPDFVSSSPENPDGTLIAEFDCRCRWDHRLPSSLAMRLSRLSQSTLASVCSYLRAHGSSKSRDVFDPSPNLSAPPSQVR